LADDPPTSQTFPSRGYLSFVLEGPPLLIASFSFSFYEERFLGILVPPLKETHAIFTESVSPKDLLTFLYDSCFVCGLD